MSRFKKAVRVKKKLKLGLVGPSGSGKTYSSLLIARGVVGENGKIAVIDTESGSSNLYAHLTNFEVDTLEYPFIPEKFKESIVDAINEEFDAVIIDTLTPSWDYFLGEHEKIARRSGNSFTAWSKITPPYRDFINFIIEADIHIILTLRAKTKYNVTSSPNGKMNLKKIGIGPMFRNDVEFEPDLVFSMMNDEKDIIATVSKTRMEGLFELGDEFTPTEETGQIIIKWLNEGKDALPKSEMRGPPLKSKIISNKETFEEDNEELW